MERVRERMPKKIKGPTEQEWYGGAKLSKEEQNQLTSQLDEESQVNVVSQI